MIFNSTQKCNMSQEKINENSSVSEYKYKKTSKRYITNICVTNYCELTLPSCGTIVYFITHFQTFHRVRWKSFAAMTCTYCTSSTQHEIFRRTFTSIYACDLGFALFFFVPLSSLSYANSVKFIKDKMSNYLFSISHEASKHWL